MPTIKLQSSEGKIFEVELETAKASVTIKTMTEDLGIDENEQEVLPLHNVNSAILEKVLQWATYHRHHPPKSNVYENGANNSDDMCSWYKEFLNVDLDTLKELLLAANYLDIEGLLELTSKAVANIIKGKSAREIRKTFNIKKDFSPNEEERMAEVEETEMESCA